MPLIALDIDKDGVFTITRTMLDKTKFKPRDKIKVTHNKNYIYIAVVGKIDYNANYYTYVLDDGKICVKNPNWNTPGVYELTFLGRTKIKISKAKVC